MGCGASTAAPAAAPENNTISRPAPLEIARPNGDAPRRRGSNAAERAEAAAEAAASPTSGDRTRWQATADRQSAAREEAVVKLEALGVGKPAQQAALAKAELPVAEGKQQRVEAWLRDLDERATAQAEDCDRVEDECKQLEELKAGTRKRADMQNLLMSIAVQAGDTCAAAEEHAVQAVAGLRELTGLEGLAEIAAWQDPPPDAHSIFQAVLCLLAGVEGSGVEGSDGSWSSVCSVLADAARFAECLEPSRTHYLKLGDDGQAPQFAANATQARTLMGEHVGRNLAMEELDDVQSLQTIKLPRNRAVALVCRWVVAHLAYQDAQLLLEERAGEAAFELKAHELSQHHSLQAALLVQREQASTAVAGQTELVGALKGAAGIEEIPLSEDTAARVEDIVGEYTAVLGEGADTFDDEGEDGGGYDDEESGGDEEDEEDEDDDEEVMAGAASMIQSRVRGNAARKRVDGLQEGGVMGSQSPNKKKGLAVDTDATPDFESLGPIPEPSAENGVLTVADEPEAVAPKSAAQAKSEFEAALGQFNEESDVLEG